MTTRIVITAEHGGNEVPAKYRSLFENAGEVLATHRGWDPGSLELAKLFARRLKAPLIAAQVTRLLVDLNRKVSNRSVFSEFTRPLDREARQAILDRYHTPHRSRVESTVRSLIDAGHDVVHIGMHSFTPELHGEVRNADIAFLYDPSRSGERSLCLAWKKALQAARPDLRVRMNYPYLGTSDGLTTTLRRVLPPESYVGFEVEVNQLWPQSRLEAWPGLLASLFDTFTTASAAYGQDVSQGSGRSG
ncbi:MAG: N-formylglutamate amidohydrolase [Planctomycetota bacterium]|nr:N-formylglutamate amidohydrolase [Planctomycetota bacterium]MDA1249088.1 N-formylglutamate amidohydrolase [Planctomycetota bacterium]